MPKFVLFAAAATLFIGAFPLPYGYYQLLRIIITIVLIWAAVAAHKGKQEALMVICGGLACLFNPVLKISLSKEVWAFLDIGTACYLIYLSRTLKSSKQ